MIKQLPPNRAPGPDNFIGLFYQRAWHIIKNDVMAVFLKLFVGHGRGFGKLNKVLITLVPKKQEALLIGDYMPISLIHCISKLFAKLLANRIRPKLEELVTTNQSAFVRGRNLHQNFMLMRQVARKINTRRTRRCAPQTKCLTRLQFSRMVLPFQSTMHNGVRRDVLQLDCNHAQDVKYQSFG